MKIARLLQLLDEETGAVQTEPWKRGELLLQSEAIMKGYLNDEEETKKVIDANKWLYTGPLTLIYQCILLCRFYP